MYSLSPVGGGAAAGAVLASTGGNFPAAALTFVTITLVAGVMLVLRERKMRLHARFHDVEPGPRRSTFQA